MKKTFIGSMGLAALGCLLLPACGDESGSDGSGSRDAGAGSDLLGSGSLGLGGDSGQGAVCKSTSSDAKILPVNLAFVLDVSGSMGKVADSACYDPDYKWKPVFAATTAFFESADTVGLNASLTLFPSKDDRCDAESYAVPVVSTEALPGDSFRKALISYEDEVEDDGWRGGTPTLAAFTGTLQSVRAERKQNPEAHFAIVFVTDGKPQGCGNDNDIDQITAAVEAAADAGISTYVIGVEQPTSKDGCDADSDNLELLDNLDDIAAVGETSEPFMIDTSSPKATEVAFTAAIQKIREKAVSCSSVIPEHPDGGSFDKDKIDVLVMADGKTTRLAHDPECASEGAWRYDDAEDPDLIELCESSCTSLRQSGASLQVDFLCQPRPDVVR